MDILRLLEMHGNATSGTRHMVHVLCPSWHGINSLTRRDCKSLFRVSWRWDAENDANRIKLHTRKLAYALKSSH